MPQRLSGTVYKFFEVGSANNGVVNTHNSKAEKNRCINLLLLFLYCPIV
jgi:hypothetical protein